MLQIWQLLEFLLVQKVPKISDVPKFWKVQKIWEVQEVLEFQIQKVWEVSGQEETSWISERRSRRFGVLECPERSEGLKVHEAVEVWAGHQNTQ